MKQTDVFIVGQGLAELSARRRRAAAAHRVADRARHPPSAPPVLSWSAHDRLPADPPDPPRRGGGGLTLAPEAGTQRLRDIINKSVPYFAL